MTTDYGILFSALNTQFNIMFHSKETDFVLRKTAEDPYIKFVIFASKEEAICSRKYQKLPEILGSLTGMANLIMFFCYMVSNLVIHISYLELLSNKLYVFPHFPKKIKKKPIKPKLSLKLEEKNKKALNQKENLIFSIPFISQAYNNADPNQLTKPNESEQNELNMKSNLSPKNLKEDSFVLQHYSQSHIHQDFQKQNDLENKTIVIQRNNNEIDQCKENEIN